MLTIGDGDVEEGADVDDVVDGNDLVSESEISMNVEGFWSPTVMVFSTIGEEEEFRILTSR